MAEADAKGRNRRFPPFAVPTESPDIPPIGMFLDELPSITEFLVSDEAAYTEAPYGNSPDVAEPLRTIDEFAPEEYDVDGWAIAGWQSFDWASLGSLGRRDQHAVADASWTETEWAPDHEAVYGGADDAYEFSKSETGADEVAAALNEIADRIRSGELAIDMFQGTPPEAALAAALAALLRMRG